MAYDEQLAERIRTLIETEPDYSERKLFGGLACMLGGNMAVGVMSDELLVRLDPAEHDTAVARPHARVFDTMGRPARGWVLVAAEGTKTKRQLETWVRRGVDYARSLPAK